MKDRRVLPPTYLLVAILVMIALHFVVPGPNVIGGLWRGLGFVPLAVGVWLNLAADGSFRRVNTTVKPYEESTALVREGAFRISRNPMYLGYVLILLGVALLMGSLTPWVVIPAFAVLMEIVFIRVEEAMLAETFGEGWTDYTRRTRRWI